MRRLVRAFAGRTYHIFENLMMSRLNYNHMRVILRNVILNASYMTNFQIIYIQLNRSPLY